MKKIIIACDSFKGSLSSERVAVSVERGICSVFPDCEVHKVSVASNLNWKEPVLRSLT